MSLFKDGKYFDPLHVPSAQLVIEHKGKELYLINRRLLDRQNAWLNLDKIKALHSEKLHLYDIMSDTESDDEFLLLCDAYCAQIEFDLQDAWGFTQDRNFHMFWQRPHCTCPSMDNRDVYGTSLSVINQSCKLHG